MASSDLRAALAKKRQLLQPPKRQPLSEWAEEYLRLPTTSAISGRFYIANAPYQREVFDTITDPQYERIVIMAASQMLKTQALLTFLGYIIHRDPGPTMIVQPSGDMVRSFAKDRVEPLIQTTPVLREMFANTSRRDGGNTITSKQFPQGTLNVVSAGSPSQLASRAIKYLLLDEVDRYEPTREGDPISLAEKRTSTFLDRKIVIVSSPGDDQTSRVSAEYKNSDRRVFECRCPSCNHYQVLQWSNVDYTVDPSKTFDQIADDARYRCDNCNDLWDDSTRREAVRNGRWVITNPDSKAAGFHISALASTFASVTLSTLVKEHLEAKGDIEKRRAFTNTRLAETFKNKSTNIQPHSLHNRMEEYSNLAIPDEIAFITAGVDVQGDRLEMEIVGWGVADENWSLDYHIIPGDPTSPTPWMQLQTLLDTTYKRRDGIDMRINATCIDSGHATQDVLNFANANKRLNIYPIKGQAGWGKTIFSGKSAHYKNKQHSRFYWVAVDVAKEKILGMLGNDTPGPNYCHFPVGYTGEYFEGLTAEVLAERYSKGKRQKYFKVKTGVRNEPLDCRVYALAARYSIRVDPAQHLDQLKARNVLPPKPKTKPSVVVQDDWMTRPL